MLFRSYRDSAGLEVDLLVENGLPPGRLGEREPLAGEKPERPLPASVAKRRLIEALRNSGARLTFLALGAPKQEMFAARCREILPDMGFASVGAGLDFLAQSQRRAPSWMRKLALEWLWRIGSNPRRLAGRYALCAVAMPRLAFSALRRAGAESPSVQGALAAETLPGG